MQEFEHTSMDDRTYTEEELTCPYFDNCYIQVRNQGACRFMCKDNPAYNKEDQNDSERMFNTVQRSLLRKRSEKQ